MTPRIAGPTEIEQGNRAGAYAEAVFAAALIEAAGGITVAEAAQRLNWGLRGLRDLRFTGPLDASAIDYRPDDCWRCDSGPAITDVGLCGSCHDHLRAP